MKVEDLFNLDPIAHANLKIWSEIKGYLETELNSKGSFEVIQSFSDDFYQPIDLAIFLNDENTKYAVLLFNTKHYFGPTIADRAVKFALYNVKAQILESYGWKVV